MSIPVFLKPEDTQKEYILKILTRLQVYGNPGKINLLSSLETIYLSHWNSLKISECQDIYIHIKQWTSIPELWDVGRISLSSLWQGKRPCHFPKKDVISPYVILWCVGTACYRNLNINNLNIWKKKYIHTHTHDS